MIFNFPPHAHETGALVACQEDSVRRTTRELRDKPKQVPGPAALAAPFSALRGLFCFPFLSILTGI